MPKLESPTAQPEWQVPSFVRHEFHARRSEYCIGIPVLNEGTKFFAQLERMTPFTSRWDLVIADGGSTCAEEIVAGAQHRSARAVLVKTGPGALSAQLRMLFAWAIREGYRGIVILDGNGKDGVDAIPEFVHRLDEGFDYIQGSRFITGGREENTPLDRKLGLKYIHAPLLSLAARFRYTDTTNGFRALSSRFLVDHRLQPFRAVFDTYNLHFYLSIQAPRLGYRVCEIPVSRSYPPAGPTPSKIHGWHGRWEILRLLLKTVAGHYNP